MTILVTGAAGFLGSHVVDALVAAGHRVVGIDHHRREKLRFPNTAVVMHKVGFEDAAVADIFAAEHPDAVIHLAAQISVTKSISDPLFDARRNVLDSLALLRLARRFGVKKFVFASSGGAIYGDHPVRPTPILDDATPVSPYGVGKLVFESYLTQQSHDGVPCVALRFANLYGPRQQLSPLGEGNVVSIFLNAFFRGEPVTMFGDGTASRDYLYAADAVNAIMRAVTGSFTGIVNVSTGRETSVRELFDTLVAIHGKAHPFEHRPFRKGEVYRSVLAYDSAREHLGWEPMTSLYDGLAATYAWYRETFGGDRRTS